MNQLYYICTITLFFVCVPLQAWSTDVEHPLQYPQGATITSSHPVFIWRDLYQTQKKDRQFYRLTITSAVYMKPITKIFSPQLFYNSIYTYKLPDGLKDGLYDYKIEYFKMKSQKTKKKRYFHASRYPIMGSFVIDTAEECAFDNLPPGLQAKYLHDDHYNTIENGYNTLFFTGAATGSLGIGWLFYRVLTFGKISRIIAYIAFASAAVGYSASLYYGYNYFHTNSGVQDILNSEDAAAKAAHSAYRYCFSVHTAF
jgi:hypothetical protein